MLYPSELGSKDLSDYKNTEAYSYYKSRYFNLCNIIIFQEVNTVSSGGECKKSLSIKHPFHKRFSDVAPMLLLLLRCFF